MEAVLMGPIGVHFNYYTQATSKTHIIVGYFN